MQIIKKYLSLHTQKYPMGATWTRHQVNGDVSMSGKVTNSVKQGYKQSIGENNFALAA